MKARFRNGSKCDGTSWFLRFLWFRIPTQSWVLLSSVWYCSFISNTDHKEAPIQYDILYTALWFYKASLKYCTVFLNAVWFWEMLKSHVIEPLGVPLCDKLYSVVLLRAWSSIYALLYLYDGVPKITVLHRKVWIKHICLTPWAREREKETTLQTDMYRYI